MGYLTGIPLILAIGWLVAQIGRAGGWYVPNDIGWFGYGMLGLLSILISCPFVMVGIVLWLTFSGRGLPIHTTVVGLMFFGGVAGVFAYMIWKSRKP